MERKKKPRANTISAMVAAAGGDPKDHYVDENYSGVIGSH